MQRKCMFSCAEMSWAYISFTHGCDQIEGMHLHVLNRRPLVLSLIRATAYGMDERTEHKHERLAFEVQESHQTSRPLTRQISN